MVEGLHNLCLTKEEEEEITITTKSRTDLLEGCVLSLFGRLLSDRHHNLRALKNTLKSAWKMGSDLQIVEVGNSVLQFKFNSEYQLQWVERNGPWNFENNLLLLCRWRKGLSASNIVFTHSPFWVQIWDLPFEHMSMEVGRDLGNCLGKFIESDRRTGHSNQAKFMRIRVDLQLDKPLRRRGKVASEDGEKFWVSFKYKRLPTFCYFCGRLGHDDKHYPESAEHLNSPRQYGDWLRAYGNLRNMAEKSKSTSSDGGGVEEYAAQREVHTHSAERHSSDSVINVGCSSLGGYRKSDEKNSGLSGNSNGAESEEKNGEKIEMECDNPTRASKHAEFSELPTMLPCDSGSMKQAHVGLLGVGRTAKEELGLSVDPSHPKPTALSSNADLGNKGFKNANTSPSQGKKQRAKVQIKKLARELGKGKSPDSDSQVPPVGSKRDGKHIFEDDGEDSRTKKRCTKPGISQPTIDERSAVAAVQHRREQ